MTRRGVEIHVNGRDLIDIVREIELPYAGWDAGIAGSYCVLAPDDVLPPSGHFFGAPLQPYVRDDGKIPILGCAGCGAVECWPLIVRIDAKTDVVRWSEFEQPNRPKWKYRDLELRFCMAQYRSALNQAARRLR